MKNISIPTPCHENWADFTPTEKGAFCGSCKIDVVDFSNKNPNQIKSILKENAGKQMCGRFKKSQLVELNDDFFAWQNQSAKSFQSKFLYACILVFGMTLFTGCSSNHHIMGDVVSFFESNTDNSSLSQLNIINTEIEGDTIKKSGNHHKMGKIAYVPEDTTEPITVTDSVNTQSMHVKGEFIAPIEEPEMLLGEIAVIEDDSIVQEEIPPITDDNLFDDTMVDGGLMIEPDFLEYVEDTIQSKKPNTETITNQYPNQNSGSGQFNIQFDCKIFPNPASTKTTVALDIIENSSFEIYLYAIDGKHVKYIFQGELFEGYQEFIIDLKSYKSGSYLLVVRSENQKESLRLEKTGQ